MQTRVCACQEERQPIVFADGLQPDFMVSPVVNEPKLFHHLPEHPLNTNPDLRKTSVVRFLNGVEVCPSESAVDVRHDRIRGIAVDLALHGIPLLHCCKPAVESALGQEVRVMESTGPT